MDSICEHLNKKHIGYYMDGSAELLWCPDCGMDIEVPLRDAKNE